MIHNTSTSDEALAELLTLTVEVDEHATTYYRNHLGQKHRVHGPAVIWDGGNEYWYHGALHREDGPAIEYTDSTKVWYQNGLRHRTDGPAIEWCDGDKEWLINGQRLTEREFNERIRSM